MKPLWKDMLTAIFMGMILPGILLNAAAVLLDSKDSAPQETIPQETAPETVPLTMRLRVSDGTTEEMDMDTYLVGVVLAEMPASFESEALKAQSVVARTYTRKAYETGGKHGDGSVCANSACCQAYISPDSYLSKGGTQEGLDKIRAAVAETSGFVLTYGDELIEATYFSCSGGSTEDAAAVWGTDFRRRKRRPLYGYRHIHTPAVPDSTGYGTARNAEILVWHHHLYRRRRHCHHDDRRGSLYRHPAALTAESALHSIHRLGHGRHHHHHHQRLRPPGRHEPIWRRRHGGSRQYLCRNPVLLLPGNDFNQTNPIIGDVDPTSSKVTLLNVGRGHVPVGQSHSLSAMTECSVTKVPGGGMPPPYRMLGKQ